VQTAGGHRVGRDAPPSKRGAGWGIRRNVDVAFAHHRLRREVIVEVADCSTACALAVCGLGIAFVVPSVVSVSDAVLHRTDPAIDFEVSLVASKSSSRAATRAFVELVAKRFRGDGVSTQRGDVRDEISGGAGRGRRRPEPDRA
jgi:DNA-binding transcriptional LysR family regulator